MKKFNLFKEIITVEKSELLKAVNSSKLFGINISGEIKYSPFHNKEILIYEGKHTPQKSSALMPPKPLSLSQILGKNYQVVEDDDRVLVKAFSNWQELIGINMPRASYDDTTNDGVDKFSNPQLEDIGWYATDFDIDYRDYVDLFEEKAEGVLLCIEQEEPYQFSGLGFLTNETQAHELMFDYSKKAIEKLIKEDPLFAKEDLSDDEAKAAKFFALL